MNKGQQRAIIRRPVLTEKATILREGNVYTFRVDSRANKVQIRQAIESIFDVHVESVRTVSVPGKSRRLGFHQGRVPGWKKAYVSLQKGESIDVMEDI